MVASAKIMMSAAIPAVHQRAGKRTQHDLWQHANKGGDRQNGGRAALLVSSHQINANCTSAEPNNEKSLPRPNGEEAPRPVLRYGL